MRIRDGFCSNSSSSSFLIYGLFLEEAELADLLGLTEDEESYNDIYEKLEELNIDYHYPDGYDGYYVGESLENCRDDQTMGDFKKQVRDDLNSKFKKKVPDENFGIHEEAYYG
jgi:hypothetical protein